jgi:hypothetical protein
MLRIFPSFLCQMLSIDGDEIKIVFVRLSHISLEILGVTEISFSVSLGVIEVIHIISYCKVFQLVAPEGFEPVTVCVLSAATPTSWSMGLLNWCS